MKSVLIICIFLLVFIPLSQASDIERRRAKIIEVIDEELQEVERLSKNTGRRNPDLLLRTAELNLEKARLYREKENNDFLNIPPAKRRKISPKKFYAKSARYFSKANSIALEIARKYKSYSRIGEVYYILGFNAKEANKQKTASKYLSLASKKSKDKKTKTRTQISLAEVFYNQKKYNRAAPLYEKALRNVKDKWWTKDSFNLAWCYFRLNKTRLAINTMLEVYKRSKSKKYIDMRSQVERDIGLFYATSSRVPEGVSFYKKIGVNFTNQLITIAISLKEQGKFTMAEKVLDQAEKFEKSQKKLNAIYIEKLLLFEKYGKYDAHLFMSKKLQRTSKTAKLTKEQKSQYIFQLAKVSAILQRQAVGKTYKNIKKMRRKKADQAIEYFGILALVDSSKRDEYTYLQAETAYAVGWYTKAFEYYKETYQYTSRSNRTSAFKKKALEAMLVTLSAFKKSSAANNIYVFEEYLKTNKNGQKAKDISIRLFNNYMDKKDYAKAQGVLDRFSKQYPKDKSQEAMLAQLMEVSRKKRDNERIRAWISDIEAGKYFVSNKYRNKLQALLTSLQIDDVQNQLAKGDKKTALVGYLKILDDPYSTKKSKINAKYNLAALYFELGDAANTHKWAISAIQEMNASDVYKFSSSFVTMTNFLFSALEFSFSTEISEEVIKKLCKRKTKRKNLAFKNASFIALADGKIQQAEELVRLAKTCKIPRGYIDEVEYEIMREYFVQKNWNRYEFYVMQLKDAKRSYHRIIDDLLNLISIHSRFNNVEKIKRFNQYLWNSYFRAKKNKRSISMRGLDYFASLKIKSMQETINKMKLIKFQFPEQKFAGLQKKKLNLLTKLTSQANDVQSVGSGVGIVNSFKLLFESYKEVAQEIYDFVPQGKSADYIKKFKIDFNQVGKQLESAADQYRAEARKAIRNNAILNKNNFYFQSGKYPIEFHGEDSAVLMDRGGRK